VEGKHEEVPAFISVGELGRKSREARRARNVSCQRSASRGADEQLGLGHRSGHPVEQLVGCLDDSAGVVAAKIDSELRAHDGR
jgi:hypothetical protein